MCTLRIIIPAFLLFFLFPFFGAAQRDSLTTIDTNRVYTLADTVLARELLEQAIQLNKQYNYNEAYSKADSARSIFTILLGEATREVADALIQMGRNKYSVSLIDEAINLFERSLIILSEKLGSKHIDVANLYEFLGICFENKGKYDESVIYHRKALDIRLEILGSNNPIVANSYGNLGVSYFFKGEYDNSNEYYQKALNIHLASVDSNYIEVSQSYENLGITFTLKGDYSKAQDYLAKALNLLLKKLNPSHPLVGKSYSNLGVLFAYKGDYYKATDFFEKDLKIRLEILGEKHPEVARAYANIGSAYQSKGAYDKSIEYHMKALNIYHEIFDSEHPAIARIYNTLGTTFKEKVEYDTALDYYEKALNIRLKTLGIRHPEVAQSYNNLGVLYTLRNNFEEAVNFFLKALDIQLQALGSNNPEVAISYLNIAGVYARKKDYSEAIEYNQKALQCVQYENYNFQEVSSALEQVISALKSISSNYIEYYEQRDELEYLNKSYQYIQEALAAIAYQNSSFTTELTKILWQTQNYSIYEAAIDVTLEKFKANNSQKLVQQAFIYSESVKSTLLQSQIKEADAFAFTGLPDSLLQKEYNLRIDLTYYDKQRQQKLSEGLSETDTTVLAISSKLFDLNREYEALKDSLEKNYPQYYKAKYDLSTVSVQYVQDTLLQPNQSLLEYFVGDSSIFIFLVQPDHYEVQEVKRDPELSNWIQELRDSTLLARYQEERYGEQADRFVELSSRLYETLIAPIADKLDTSVIIVPDGVLSYLPFELLLTEKPVRNFRFKTHKYLMKKHRISYCYSATLLREMRERQHLKEPQKMLLGVAPYYDGDTTLLASLYPYSRDVEKGLLPLQYTGEEVFHARQAMEGDVFIGEAATEDQFTAVAGNYRILHLATHGQANDQVGDYSFLVFTEQKDSVENELLYVRDLYNLQLNADLVVLSACETGIGELQRGEGVVSLARAFAYAGAKSIVTSLWSVDDKSTMLLMKAFYEHLSQGATKDEALWKAKLDYLEQASGHEEGHPFYWAGFIPIGDMAAVR